MNQIILSFLTGLTTGGISCLAVQGGLLTSSISNRQDATHNRNDNWKYVLIFLISKLIAYSILGLFLGLIGSFLILSLKIQAVIQIAIGIFLIGTAGRLFNIHPIFRYFAITPPKFVYKIARVKSKSGSFFAPIILGALTVLMPCGVTQAMMAVALGTGNPLYASLIMASFIIGTSPLFFTLGIITLEALKKKAFSYFAATVILIFAILSINGALGLLGSVHTLQNYWYVIMGNKQTQSAKESIIKDGVQEVTIYVTDHGYKSNTDTLKANVPVKLRLKTENTIGCSRAFTIPQFNISKILPASGEEIIEFTPTKEGRLSYTCSMGMYSGSFKVIE